MTDTLARSAPPAFGDDDHAALLDSVRRLLADRCAQADVRRTMASETGHDPELWRALSDMGLPGFLTAASRGGGGLDVVAAELVMEEAGAALLPAPLISAWAACRLLDAAGEETLEREIASGERLACVAFCGEHLWQNGSILRVEDGKLTGTARFVPDAQIADTILIVFHRSLYLLDRGAADIAPLPVFDRTRRIADVTITGEARRLGDARGDEFAWHVALVALAGERAGGARRVLDMAVDYARERHQFGRAIGSFQAIKHMAADLLLEVESATSAARHAAQALTEFPDDYLASVALAAFTCADAFVRVAKDAVQMHGGIAFTWDHPAHLYLRRARSAAQLYGDSAHWRERYVRALEAVA